MHKTTKALAIAFSLGLAACSSSAESAAERNAQVTYLLNFGREVRTVTKGDVVFEELTGGGNGEFVELDLNGHPLVFQWRRAYSKSINQLLLPPGKQNKLKLVSPAVVTGMLEVTSTEEPFFEHTPQRLALAALHESRTLEFRADAGAEFSFETIDAGSEANRTELRRELLSEVQAIHADIKNGNSDTVAATLIEGYRQWSRAAYGAAEAQFQQNEENLKRVVKKYGADCPVPDWEQLHFAFGDRSVYVYSNWSKTDEMLTPYLFRLGDLEVWPLRYVRLNGRWVVWEFNR